MGHPLRWLSHELVFVTTRCHQERFFLTPYSTRNAVRRRRRTLKKGNKGRPRKHGAPPGRCDDPRAQLRALVASVGAGEPIAAEGYTESAYNVVGVWLAKALARHPSAKLLAFVGMDNHIHLLLWVPIGELPELMKYFNGQLARALNRLLGRNHQFWSRRYSAEPVLDEASALDRAAYIHTNPSAANLVEKACDWPGLSSLHRLDGARTHKFVFFNRTRWHRNHKPKNLRPYLEVVELTVHKLPSLHDKPDGEYAELLRRQVEERDVALAAARDTSGRSVLPLAKLKATDPMDRPNNPKRSPRPKCHAACPKRRDDYIERYRAVRALHHEASTKYRNGDRSSEFPDGTMPPPIVSLRAA